MKNLWRHSAHCLTATGAIHTVYALWGFHGSFWAMLRGGLIGSGG